MNDQVVVDAQVEMVDLGEIRSNPFNARAEEDPAAVREVAISIARQGLLQPPAARKNLGSYELVFGHTRKAAYELLASQGIPEEGIKAEAKWKRMPLRVHAELSDRVMFEQGLSENLKRRNLNTMEVAAALQRYMDEFGATSEEAGKLFDLAAATVRGKVRLLELQPEIQAMLASGELAESSGRQLIAIERLDPKLSAKAAKEIVRGEIPAMAVNQAIEDTAAIHMHSAWAEGAPGAGEGLWPLDLPMDQFPRERLPELTEAQRKLREAKKTADVFAVLNSPPACTSCPFYTRVHGEHYCGLPECHARKAVAWMDWSLEETGKKLRIKIFDPKLDKEPLSLRYYEGAHKALWAKKHADLRLKLGRSMYGGFDLPHGMTVVVVGEAADKLRKAKQKTAANRGQAGGKEELAEQALQQQMLQLAREESVRQFVRKEALPQFQKALAGLTVLPVLEWITDNIYGSFDEIPPGAKAPAAQRAAYYRRAIAYELIFNEGIDNEIFDDSEQPLTDVAKWLLKEAGRWGIKLPKGFMEKAKKLDAELNAQAVAAETERGEEDPEAPAKGKKKSAKAKPAAKKLSKRAKKKKSKGKSK